MCSHLNVSQRKHNFLLSIDVGVEHTQNVLKFLGNHQGLKDATKFYPNDGIKLLYEGEV